MRRRSVILLVTFVILAGVFVLNMQVTTKQGVDYKIHSINLPLYLKVLDFYDRHFNYKWLVHNITKGKHTQQEKIMALLTWTAENIRPQPKELRIIDDHVWHIIVMGYGTHEQLADVFACLCNYVGVRSLFMRVFDKGYVSLYSLAFVEVDGVWTVFDPYLGIYFSGPDRTLAGIDTIRKSEYTIKSILKNADISKAKYEEYVANLPSAAELSIYHKYSRSNIQSPLNRLYYAAMKRFLPDKQLIDSK